MSVVDIPSIEQHPEYADAATHEFAHAFERGVDSLMLIETWHFIQRLRREAKVRERLARWRWDDKFFGFRDEFGDEYMGRVYTNPRTGVTGVTAMNGLEIFSTASQTLWATDPSRNDPTLDPEARRAFMALLALLDPPPPEKWEP